MHRELDGMDVTVRRLGIHVPLVEIKIQDVIHIDRNQIFAFPDQYALPVGPEFADGSINIALA